MARTQTTLRLPTMTMTVLSADPPAKYNRNHGTLTTATTLTMFCVPLTIPTIQAYFRRTSKGEKMRPKVQHWKDKKQIPTKRCIHWFLSG
jgi:hypothetical protein